LIPLIVLLLLALAAIAFLILQPLLAGDDGVSVPAATTTSASASQSRTPAPTPTTTSPIPTPGRTTSEPTPDPTTSEPDESTVVSPSAYLGRNVDEVTADLIALGFGVNVVQQDSEEADGTVLAINPSGAQPPGTTINVTSSRQVVTVPDGLEGSTDTEVERTLVDLGLVPVNVGSEQSQQPEGTVIRVNPGASTVLPAGSTVGYVVSSGPPVTQAPTTPTPPPTATPTPTPTTVPTPSPTATPTLTPTGGP